MCHHWKCRFLVLPTKECSRTWTHKVLSFVSGLLHLHYNDCFIVKSLQARNCSSFVFLDEGLLPLRYKGRIFEVLGVSGSCIAESR